MQEKKLTLFKTENELGEAEYQVSEQDIPNAEPLASYNDIGELYPNFYDTNDTYDMQAFTSNSSVKSFYATTPTRSVSDAARSLIGAANSVHQMGEGNSQFGTRWIHSVEEKRSKKIRATDEIPKGWLEGRKMKFDDEEK